MELVIIGFGKRFWYFTTEINKADAVTMAAAEHADEMGDDFDE